MSSTPKTDFAVRSCTGEIPRPLHLTSIGLEIRLTAALSRAVAAEAEIKRLREALSETQRDLEIGTKQQASATIRAALKD